MSGMKESILFQVNLRIEDRIPSKHTLWWFFDVFLKRENPERLRTD